jgi:hypothetical protein
VKSLLFKVSSILLLLLIYIPVFFMAGSVMAATVHISYTDSNLYSEMEDQLEDMGFTVTGTNSGSININDFSSKDLHINVAGSSNCGSTCKTAYETYIGNGGTVLIAGNGDNDGNRTGNIEQLIESKLSVGTITVLGTDANFVSYANGTQYSGDATSGYWVTRNLFSMNSGGTALGSNNSNGTHQYKSWAAYSYGDNGGRLLVTLDQTQFNNTTADWITRAYAFLQQTLTEEGILTSSTAGITSTQQTKVTNTQATSQNNNKIYINQSGTGIQLNITQDGDDNLVIGPDLTAAGQLTGDNIELTITQTNNNNIIGIDIDGNSNDVDITQNLNQSALIDITGASNTLNLNQTHLNNNGEHFADIKIIGSSNVLDIDQTETGDKTLFLDIDGSNNVTVDQKGTGNHFLDVTLTDGHTIDVTQDGSGNHNAELNLSGNNTTLNLTQDSSTAQNYYLHQNCTQTSCSATVTQN